MYDGQQFTSLLFLRLFSMTQKTSINAQSVCIQPSLLATKQKLPGCKFSDDPVVIKIYGIAPSFCDLKFYDLAYFLNQARRPARTWFLEITFIPPRYVCVCPPPGLYITSGVILTLNDWLNNCGCFSAPSYGSCH